MKKIYHDEFAVAIEKYVSEHLPNFTLFRWRRKIGDKSESTMGRGGTYYRTVREDGTAIFLAFWAAKMSEALRLDIGWSRSGRFPYDIDRPLISLLKSFDFESLPDEGWVDEVTTFQVAGATKAPDWQGWQAWRCSVSPKHPQFRRIFIEESLRQVTGDDARRAVENTLPEVFSDMQNYVQPFLTRLSVSFALKPALQQAR